MANTFEKGKPQVTKGDAMQVFLEITSHFITNTFKHV